MPDPEPIDALYAVADDYESDVLDSLRRRAGFTWKCACRWTNLRSDTRCDGCGAQRTPEPGDPCGRCGHPYAHHDGGDACYWSQDQRPVLDAPPICACDVFARVVEEIA